MKPKVLIAGNDGESQCQRQIKTGKIKTGKIKTGKIKTGKIKKGILPVLR